MNRVLIPLTLITAFSLTAAAQQPAQSTPAQPVPAQPGKPVGFAGGQLLMGPTDAQRQGPPVSVNFPGGSLEEFVNLLRSNAKPDQPVNITYSKDAAALPLPAVKMESVSLSAVLKSLEYLVSSDAVQMSVSNLTDQHGPEPTAAFVISCRMSARPFDGPQTLKVFSVNDLIAEGKNDPSGRIPAETLLTAIKTALAQVPLRGASTADVKFHADSRLLIVRGATAELDAINQVIAELSDTVRQSAKIQRTAESRKVDAVRAAQHLQLAMKEKEFALARLDRTRKAAEAGQLPVDEVGNAEMQVARIDSEVQIAMAEKENIERGITGPDEASGDLAKRVADLEVIVADLRNMLAAKNAPKPNQKPGAAR
ncbi:MAG: hypothetical protein JSR77_11390 [Planctomycetes bacterium]|nr:hypothetical protein [Planctomycetota bacterium]